MKLDYHMGFKDTSPPDLICVCPHQRKAVGGISGCANGSSASVSNCYNIGDIDGSGSASVGAVIGHMNNANGTTAKLYYLSSSYSKGIGVSSASTQAAESMRSNKMQDNSFVSNLNDGLASVAFVKAVDDYPILAWQSN